MKNEVTPKQNTDDPETQKGAESITDALFKSQAITQKIQDFLNEESVSPLAFAFALTITNQVMALQVPKWHELRIFAAEAILRGQKGGAIPSFFLENGEIITRVQKDETPRIIT